MFVCWPWSDHVRVSPLHFHYLRGRHRPPRIRSSLRSSHTAHTKALRRHRTRAGHASGAGSAQNGVFDDGLAHPGPGHFADSAEHFASDAANARDEADSGLRDFSEEGKEARVTSVVITHVVTHCGSSLAGF